MIAAILALSAVAFGAEAPVFDAERGLYTAPFSLELSGAAGETLWFSTDGGTPDTLYVGAIPIDKTAVVRARAQDAAGAWSSIATATYLFIDDVMAQPALDPGITTHPTLGPRMAASLASLPTLSLGLDGALSVVEQPVSFEYIEPGGLSLQADCGVARVGGHSLGYPKTNLRLYFRDAYGDGKLDADFFEDQDTVGVPSIDRHDSLDLRGGSHDSVFYLGVRGQYLRNRWMDETELEMGHVAPHGRFAHLYVNGEYTGLYHLRERFDAAFLAEHRGGTEDDWAAVNGGRAVDGDGAQWPRIEAAGGDFETFSTWVDVSQYLDYIVLNLFGANSWDWNAHQNWMAAGPLEPRSGWVFHSSDSDIALYYGVDHWVLDRPGPGYTLQGLLGEGHPDFQVALADALQRNLRDGGPLTGPRAADRYARLAPLAEDAVVAEAARWGGGAWDPTLHWTAERDYLVESWLPGRAEQLWAQAEAAGWLPLPAPILSPPAGALAPGSAVEVAVPEGTAATLWLRLDGGDPRLAGGAVAAEALDAGRSFARDLDRGLQVSARLEQDGLWGPQVTVFWEVAASAPIVLNEWNAVAADKLLEDGGEDTVFGSIEGNGGDWVELLVLHDGLDLRGARLTMSDLYGDQGSVQLTDHAVLADLSAGTLLTIGMLSPEDVAYDPEGGDWRFHLRASPDGVVARSDGFDVTQHNWQLSIWNAEGDLLFGPVGEGRAPASGISSREVGLLAATPNAELRPDSPFFRAGHNSSYGEPNQWEGGAQDLSELRGEGAADSGQAEGEDGPGARNGAPADPPTPPAPGARGAATGCSALPRARLPLGALLLGAGGLLWRRRRTRWVAAGLLAGCSPSPSGRAGGPGAPAGETGAPGEDTDAESGADGGALPCTPGPERCNGVDDDCDGRVDDADDDLVDGLPFYEDADGDGYGDRTVTACRLGEGLSLVEGDCDDGDASRHPGAAERCDAVDDDCDGHADDALGLSEACPIESCAALLALAPDAADGAYWLALPSGTTAPVWCDLSGGGWTLGFLRNSAAVGNQADAGQGEVSLAALALDPAGASASTTAALGWQDLNSFVYEELALAAYAGGVATYRSEPIPRAHLRIAFGEDGYRLYGGESPYIWCGGAAAYTDGGLGAVNNPPGAPANCRGHGSLGSGWDFSTSPGANAGLTLCGSDGSGFLAAAWGGGWVAYGNAGGAQAIWVR